MSVDPNTLAKVGLAAWEQRNRFQEAWLRLRRKLAENQLTIAVFGAGGVGKTTLGIMLSEDFSPQAKPEPYKESIATEDYWLKSNPIRSVIVAPGQEQRIGRYWPSIYERLRSAKTAVVIHVVAYGYHALNPSVTLVERENVVADYLAQSRQREMEILQGLVENLKVTTIPVKMLTLVTKQDLWWSESEQVKQHYESSVYAEQIAQIQAAKGEHHFIHEFAYASLHLHNLKTGDGKIIAQTTAGYDDELRVAGQQRAFEIIEGFAK